jgi:hypothetical protein
VYGRSILGLVLRCRNASSTLAALVVCVALGANAFGQFEKATHVLHGRLGQRQWSGCAQSHFRQRCGLPVHFRVSC